MTGYLWHGKPDLELLNAEIMRNRERNPEDDTFGHGTLTGYRKHRKEKTTPCPACKRAAADVVREWTARNREQANRKRREWNARRRKGMLRGLDARK